MFKLCYKHLRQQGEHTQLAQAAALSAQSHGQWALLQAVGGTTEKWAFPYKKWYFFVSKCVLDMLFLNKSPEIWNTFLNISLSPYFIWVILTICVIKLQTHILQGNFFPPDSVVSSSFVSTLQAASSTTVGGRAQTGLLSTLPSSADSNSEHNPLETEHKLRFLAWNT